MTGNTQPKYPAGTPRKHHFIPRGYLAGFCRDDGGRLALYDRARGDYRDRQRILDVAHIKDYYAYETASGELNFDVERALGEIESKALPVIHKIDVGEQITGDERYALALYVAFQHTRTPVFEASLHSFSSALTGKLAAIAPVPPGGQPMTEDEIAKRWGLEINRPDSLRMMLDLSPEIAETLYGMEWRVARRPDDKTSFITTDSPFSLMPGPDYVPGPFGDGMGIKTPGVFKTLPLSQASFLLIGASGSHMSTITLTRDQVRDTNIAVATRCRNFVFGRELPLVERVVKAAGIDRTQWVPPVTRT